MVCRHTPIRESVLNLTIMDQESWKATVAAIEEKQSALGSLAEVVLPNRRVLNVITAEARGVCALLNQICCLIPLARLKKTFRF